MADPAEEMSEAPSLALLAAGPKDASEGPESAEDLGLDAATEEVQDAFKSGNRKALKEALLAFVQIASSRREQ